MPNELGPIRRSQAITTYGPGAIVDFRVGGHRGGAVSVIAAGLEQWDENASAKGVAHPQTTHEPRLERKLKVRGFRLPPVVVGARRSEYEDQLVGVRFPRWLQCPRCNRLALDGPNTTWQKAPGDARRYCPTCRVGNQRVHAVPVRLVTACRNGHIDEFPWSYWVHGRNPDHEPDLRLVQGRGSGIGSLLVKCVADGCHSGTRSLAGCFGKNALGLKCRGRRPWLEVDDSACGEDLRTVQRGASNLYFPITESALDIPPWADRIQKQIGVYWSRIESQPTQEDRATLVRMLGLSEELGIPETDLLQAIEDRLGLLEIAPGIREDEYRNFMKGQNPAIGSEVDFQIEPADIPDRFKGSLAKLVKAKRLREVRVLRGFTRLEPYAGPEDDPRIAPIGARPLGWLPGIEIRGEGIFFALDPAALRAWETTRRVRDRVATLSARVPTDRKINTEEATPRTILLHTLSHLLMSELALECGYSQASLRERIYVSEDEMAGALVYTGTPDSEGTLGGLVRQGDPERFAEIMLASLQRASWCANDPLCIEGTTTLSDVLNLAACHSCCLVPETSCEKFNRLLDRGLLIGTPSDPQIGFFQRLL